MECRFVIGILISFFGLFVWMMRVVVFHSAWCLGENLGSFIINDVVLSREEQLWSLVGVF